jgi:hypothetical protein
VSADDEPAHPGYGRVAVTWDADAKEVLRVEMPPPSEERIVAVSVTDDAGVTRWGRVVTSDDGAPSLVWGEEEW